ncbi:hypothetical protein QQF73_04840 [Marinobacter sp. M216]|uniref:DUF481 domain-containing protein n=1 Tax=Marinobacter albus TaxID=3030833 RepID=A0ABT7H9B4_9GAMM|nr:MULTISPECIES: hypothetical protein [unclassified Marinobacter]MBW7470787.1 hypothetical protein [Marinobacter sp. F4218]MDK9556943.1 hypothetical protein [Marinobacter sp. M216]
MKPENRPSFSILAIVFCLAIISARTSLAETESEAFPDRTMIQLGALFVLDSNTSLTASGVQTGLGTTIDFERDLDGDTTITTPSFEFYYRFNSRHRLELAAFQLERDGSRAITRTITFRDRTFTTSTQVDSTINNDVYKVAYAYSFFHIDQVELAFSAGLNVLDYEAELASSAGGFAETAATTAPMPVFGFRMDYAATPRLTVRFRTDTFYFDFEDKIRGSLLELQFGAEYRVFRNFSVGGSLSRLAIDVDVDDDDFNGSLDDLYRGARLYGAFYF